ncbi:C'' protein [Walkabout Creek virus]|uniref:C'' protein n=1 Tax=Walkabout Creek virus TaxID=1569258 RepID=A0A0A0V5L7_9RHAB|nr:C'' protein [Walkabout Creek virus]AIW61114.1 C'' protein [Walkabout Creek virus]
MGRTSSLTWKTSVPKRFERGKATF